MDKKQVISGMDSSIPKIIIIHNTIKNTCRYLKRIYLNRWQFIYYPSSGSSFPKQKTKWVIHIGNKVTVGVRSMENKKILPHANKQAKIYLLDCSIESIEELTLDDSKAVNKRRFSWVM